MEPSYRQTRGFITLALTAYSTSCKCLEVRRSVNCKIVLPLTRTTQPSSLLVMFSVSCSIPSSHQTSWRSESLQRQYIYIYIYIKYLATVSPSSSYVLRTTTKFVSKKTKHTRRLANRPPFCGCLGTVNHDNVCPAHMDSCFTFCLVT